MDFAKYVSLLEEEALYFARSDLLGDPFEGSTSQPTLELRRKHFESSSLFRDDTLSENKVKHQIAQVAQEGEFWRDWTFINCWHMNEHESAAMWGLYARTNEAIAIQSTYAKLHSNLPSEYNLGEVENHGYEGKRVHGLPALVFVGEVQYANFSTEFIPWGATFVPFFYKRNHFDYERELRAVIPVDPVMEDPDSREEFIPLGLPNPYKGISVNVSLDGLIERIYVAPTAQRWFRTLVEKVTRRYGLNKPIEQSSLDEKPSY